MHRKLILSVLLVVAGTLSTRLPAYGQYIPPGVEQKVLLLLEPYGVDSPADRLGTDGVIESVAIEQQAIRITISSGETQGNLVLTTKVETERKPDSTLNSFLVYFDPPLSSGSLAGAAHLLLSAIERNDDGRFWSEFPQPAEVGTRTPVPPVEGTGYAWYDFIGEVLLGLLLVMLALLLPNLLRSLSGRPLYYWLALVGIVGLGVALRFFIVPSPEQQEAAPDEVCSADHHCNDFSPCTTDRCVEQQCVSQWAPPPGSTCCQADADCPQPADACLRAFCSPDNHLCADETLPECNVEPYAGQSRPPLDTSIGWLLAVPAKWAGNTSELARMVNKLGSSFSTLLVGLIPAVLGAPTGIALGAALLFAVSPAYLSVANTYTMGGLLTLLFLLLILIWSLQLTRSDLDQRKRYLLSAIAALLMLVLVGARLEMLLAWGVLAASGSTGTFRGRQRWFHLALVGVPGLAAFVARLAPMTGEEVSLLYPGLSPAGPLASLMANVDLLILQGVVIPFFLLVGAMGGLLVLKNQQRQLFGMSLALLAFLLLPLFFHATDYQMVRYIALPSLSLVFLGSAGLWWVGTNKVKLAWLAVLVLVVYFVLFPFTHLETVRNLGRTPDLLSHFHQM